ncbi:MAG: anaerobic ribonucleoside-triphosphate reductase activating protein [Candidatus Methanomethylicia archaeon]
MRVYVAGIRDLSLIDYPRHPCIVIWFQGCNFRCQYCYNYELWEMRNENLLMIDEIVRRIIEVKDIVEACKITGGEPSIQSEALMSIGEECKKIKLKFGIDTNGTNPRIIEKLIEGEIVDHIAIDLKAPLNVNDYTKIVGIKIEQKDLENIKRTIKLAFESNLESVEIRIPIIRSLNNNPDKMLNLKNDLLELGYVKAIEDGKNVSIEVLEVIHELAANKELRLQKNLTINEIVYLSEAIGLPKIYIRHRDLGLRMSLSHAKENIRKIKS